MKNIINEASNRPLLLKIQKRIYSMVNKHFGGIFRDDAWQNVKRLRDAIAEVDGVDDIEMWAGEYHNYLQTASTDKSPYRDYKTIVYTSFGNLSGYIRCCAAGTTEDPFSAYDIVISLYPEMNNESKRINMKKKITESQLRNIIAKSINNIIKEGYKVGEFDYMDANFTDYKPLKLSPEEFRKVDSYFHIQNNNGYKIQKYPNGEIDLYSQNGENLDNIKKFLNSNINENMKKTITESQLRQIVAESIHNVLSEISLSNYDNPSVRNGYLDGDEFSNDGVEYSPSVNPEYDSEEERWNELLSMRNKGLLSDEELDAIRDKFGY